MRAAASAVVPCRVVRSHHSMAGVPSGGAISRAHATVIGGAAGVVAGRWVGRAIGTTVVRHSNVASPSGWRGFRYLPEMLSRGICEFSVPGASDSPVLLETPRREKPIINI